jgi:hypothetical protein
MSLQTFKTAIAIPDVVAHAFLPNDESRISAVLSLSFPPFHNDLIEACADDFFAKPRPDAVQSALVFSQLRSAAIPPENVVKQLLAEAPA